ncbi:MAG: ATP-binding protein [Candidatus Didemnitutus sp.]|nr:ATP-binding protein [Candidatus Didemnitutus sp.]
MSRANWLDEMNGSPLLVHYPLEMIGALDRVRVTSEDHRGRLLVGADGLIVFDGETWRRTPFGEGYQLINAINVADDGRIICGGLNEFGYYEESSAGDFQYRSLVEFLPPEHRDVNVVWGCAEIGGLLVYFCRAKVVAWDGKKIQVWDFPTSARLSSGRFEEGWWFAHRESGLYRMTAAGPEQLCTETALPPRVPMWIGRDERGLLSIGSSGLFVVGRPTEPLWSAAVKEFFEKAPVAAALPLPRGGFLVVTLGGIAIISPAGEMLRVLNEKDGLPCLVAADLRLDRQGQLWIAAENHGLYRFSITGAVTVFNTHSNGSSSVVNDLFVREDGVYAASERGILHVARNNSGGRFKPLPGPIELAHSITEFGGHLAIGRFTRVELLVADDARAIFEQPASSFYQLEPSRLHATRIYTQHNGAITQLELTAEGAWQSEPLFTHTEYAHDFVEDELGQLWIATAKDGLLHLDVERRELTRVALEKTVGAQNANAVLARADRAIFAFLGADFFRAAAGDDRQMIKMAQLPFLHATNAVANRQGTRIYVTFARQPPAGPRGHGFGVVELDPAGQFLRWTEFRVNGFSGIGLPTGIKLEETEHSDIVWIGSTRGIIRLNLNELEQAAPPRALEVTMPREGVVDSNGEMPSFRYADHHVKISVFTPEITRRDVLWFQARLGGPTKKWSPPSRSGNFAFTRLSEGVHHFAVRAIDLGGRTSAEAGLSFRILPPWWRSTQAYVLSGMGVLGLFFLALYWRERRSRQHTEELERTVGERTAELKKANAAKDEFLSSISHEIRNPLNGVVGLTAAIKPEQLDPTVRPQFAQLRHCADHLSGMLEDLLDFSKLEAGALPLRRAALNLPELVHSLVAITSAESAAAGLPVEVAISPSVPVWVWGDPARIRQVLLNFVLNALRYAGRGQVLVTVWARPSGTDAVEVTFAVSDDGPGISLEEQQRLFTRFQRGSAARQSRTSGSGIGLAVCKSLAEKMGGRLWVESEPGHGANFNFAVPLVLAPARQPLDPDATRVVRGHALVVDDEDYNLLVMSGLLEPLGFVVTTAKTGAAALHAADGPQRFAAVFLDFALPDMSGPALARELRQRTEFPPQVPIIATTAFITADKHTECLDAGMSHVLTKPLTAEKLLNGLARSSDRWKSGSPAQLPGWDENDPLVALRFLAARKAHSLRTELELYWQEADEEIATLAAALAAREVAEASHSAHKLVGRFGFIRLTEETLVREVERSAINGDWADAQRRWQQVIVSLEVTRERINALGRADPDESNRGRSHSG